MSIKKPLNGDDASNHMVRKVLLLYIKIASCSSTVEEDKLYWNQMTDWLIRNHETKMISSSLLRKSSECLTNVRGKVCYIFDFYCQDLPLSLRVRVIREEIENKFLKDLGIDTR